MNKTPLDLLITAFREGIAGVRVEVEHEVRRTPVDDQFPERAAILFDVAGDITLAVNRLCAVAEDDRHSRAVAT